MAETITLNDGTELQGHILENGDDRIIFVYLDRLSLMDGFALMSDRNKTIRMVAMNHGNEHVYEGYTEIDSISSAFGNCNLTMRKG